MRRQRSNATPCEIPARVQAALSFLSHCESKQHTCDPLIPPQSLTPAERAVERQALQVLSLYFSGEMDYGDRPPSDLRWPPPDDGEASQMAKV